MLSFACGDAAREENIRNGKKLDDLGMEGRRGNNSARGRNNVKVHCNSGVGVPRGYSPCY